ncbi:MAG: tetratricopeptide repeat protein [Myxococcota bacterium]
MRRLVPASLALFALVALAQASQPEAALAVYEEGKVLYDAKDYAGALAKFDEAARLEPEKARWQYNRGLALRKLKRDDEARAAFLESQRLDPEYKRDEIREKLGQLSPPSTAPPGPDAARDAREALLGFACCAVLLVGLVTVVLRIVKRLRSPGAQQVPPPPPRPRVDVTPYRAALQQAGPRLGRLEHAMSLGEDPEARPHLDRAATNFQYLRRLLRGDADAKDLAGAKLRLEEALDLAEQRLRARHGAAFDVALGPKAGCFFCARPLPTPESRQSLTLKVRGQPTEVSACLPCARRAQSNDAPKVTMVDTGQGEAHWATVSGLDPYTFAYSEQGNAKEVPLGALSRGGADVSHLAMLAGAGFGGAALGAVAARVLDVDALAEAEAASAAAAAAARSAAARRSASSSWSDHS